MDLPRQNITRRIGEKGITILKTIVENRLDWNLRINHLEDDYGIDAYIDIVNDNLNVTGKSIAIQVKAGESYFRKKNQSGWIYKDNISHLNYYLNNDLPVVIVLVDNDNEKAYWCLCDASKTNRVGQDWTITVPFNQELKLESKEKLLNYVSPVRDYASQLEHFWKENEFLASQERIIFLISKEEIMTQNFQPILNGLKRLEVNENLLESLKEKVDVGIDGYDNDSRELHEVEEVRHWIDVFLDNVHGFSYFFVKDEIAQFLPVVQLCKIEHKFIKMVADENGKTKKIYEIDFTTSERYFDIIFHDLNTFCDKHGIPEEVNKEITRNVFKLLTGEDVPMEE